MCRLYGFHANVPTKVECTLVYAQNALLAQSREDARGISHADGWGIATYRNGKPEVEKRHTAAFEDGLFSQTAERVYATTVVAHVRKATVGEVSHANTHPFVCRRWVLAHNGTVTGFASLERTMKGETLPLYQGCRQGTTDSEQMFVWLLSRLAGQGIDLGDPDLDAATVGRELAGSLDLLAARCQEESPDDVARLSFILTNGEIMIASRWNRPLFWVRRQGIRDCEICGIPHVHHDDSTYRAIVVASEPISHERWEELPNGHILTIDREIRESVIPFGTPSSLHP